MRSILTSVIICRVNSLPKGQNFRFVQIEIICRQDKCE